MKRSINRAAQPRFVRRGSRKVVTVNEKGRSSGHAARFAIRAIGRDTFSDFFAREILRESLDVQAQSYSVLFEKVVYSSSGAPSGLIFIKQIVHFPEATLQSGSFSGPGRFFRMNVHGQGKFPKNYAQLVTIIMFDTQ